MLKLFLLLAVIVQTSGQCPLRRIESNGSCDCGADLGGVVECNWDANKIRISLLFCYCMTYSHLNKQTVVGLCSAMCTRRNTPDCQSFNELQSNDTQNITEETCGVLKRTGQLCGECAEHHAPPVYSYSLQCVNCSGANLNYRILQYVATAFLPLTVFYFIILLFKVSITSGSMVAYILLCQTMTTPTMMRNVFRPENYHDQSVLTRVMVGCLSIWNLDYFRTLYTPFCLDARMSTVHVLALDYLGIYPLLLILLTYVHDRYSAILTTWSPAAKLLRKDWNIHGSLIGTFVTFLVLSYVKILNVCFDLLTPVKVRNIKGKYLNHTYCNLLYFHRQINFVFLLSTKIFFMKFFDKINKKFFWALMIILS